MNPYLELTKKEFEEIFTEILLNEKVLLEKLKNAFLSNEEIESILVKHNENDSKLSQLLSTRTNQSYAGEFMAKSYEIQKVFRKVTTILKSKTSQ